MRLTLRTLLAYLDDRLAPGQAKEIGQKLKSSPFAMDLAERIKSVVRRRRLAKDTPGQKTIDANLIAEYLDDQLSTELVALIEKEILASDGSLAEVAATHQILGLLSDPVELNDSQKERLYKLGPKETSESEDSAVALAPSQEWKPMESPTAAQKSSPMILLAVMVIAWLALAATDPNLFGTTDNTAVVEHDGNQPEANDLEGTGADSNAADATNTQPADANSTAEPAANSFAANAAETPDQSVAAVNGPGAMSAADVTGASTQDVQQPVTQEPVMAANINANTNPKTNVSPATPPADVKPAPVAAAEVSLTVSDPYKMLMVHNSETSAWEWATEMATTSSWAAALPTRTVAVADPFALSVGANELGWLLSAQGTSVFRVSPEFEIEVAEGQMIVTNGNTSAQPQGFRLIAGGVPTEIALPEVGNRIIVEVRPMEVVAANDDADPFSKRVMISIHALDAKALLTVDGKPITVMKDHLLSWSSTEAPAAPALAEAGEWIFAFDEKMAGENETMKTTAQALLSAANMTEGVSAVMNNPAPLVAENAVRVAVVTKQVDSLCNALLESEQTGVRSEAIRGLQRMVGRSDAVEQQVTDILQTRWSGTETEDAIKLLKGLPKAAGEDRFTSAWVVGMLESSRLGLRELAIYNIKQLTGATENYNADDEQNRRTSSIRRWKKWLTRHDDRLIEAQP